MRLRYLSISILFVVGTTLATYSYLPDYLTQKMSRQLNKVFGKNTMYKEVPVADSLAMNHQVFEIIDSDSVAGYSIITRALGCQIGGCDKPSKDSIAFEQFYFVTAFDRNKNIRKVSVLEYTADHGYQIANKGWLKQFEKGKTFAVGENIDAISGATISVKSITKSVNEQVKIVAQVSK